MHFMVSPKLGIREKLNREDLKTPETQESKEPKTPNDTNIYDPNQEYLNYHDISDIKLDKEIIANAAQYANWSSTSESESDSPTPPRKTYGKAMPTQHDLTSDLIKRAYEEQIRQQVLDKNLKRLNSDDTDSVTSDDFHISIDEANKYISSNGDKENVDAGTHLVVPAGSSVYCDDLPSENLERKLEKLEIKEPKIVNIEKSEPKNEKNVKNPADPNYNWVTQANKAVLQMEILTEVKQDKSHPIQFPLDIDLINEKYLIMCCAGEGANCIYVADITTGKIIDTFKSNLLNQPGGVTHKNSQIFIKDNNKIFEFELKTTTKNLPPKLVLKRTLTKKLNKIYGLRYYPKANCLLTLQEINDKRDVAMSMGKSRGRSTKSSVITVVCAETGEIKEDVDLDPGLTGARFLNCRTSDGSIFVSNLQEELVYKVMDSEVDLTFGDRKLFNQVAGIATDPFGNILIGDSKNFRILLFPRQKIDGEEDLDEAFTCISLEFYRNGKKFRQYRPSGINLVNGLLLIADLKGKAFLVAKVKK